MLGPFGLGALANFVAPFQWFTISGAGDGLSVMGELGVVALLFLIGLELSYPRLMTMRRLVFGLGSLQILLGAAAIGGLLHLVGAEPEVAVVIGFSLALSSTAIVIETLSQQARLGNQHRTHGVLDPADAGFGRRAADLFGHDHERGWQNAHTAGADAGVSAGGSGHRDYRCSGGAGAAAVLPSRRIDAQARTCSSQRRLLVIVGSGLVTAMAGMSMALGAFVAGLLLAETEYRRAIQATVEPFKGLLLGVFFFWVGMSLDLSVVFQNPVWVLGGTLTLILAKIAVLLPLLWFFQIPRTAIAETVLILAPGGEFAFITITLGMIGGLLHKDLAAVMLAITTLSMLLIPLMDGIGKRLSSKLQDASELEPAMFVQPDYADEPRAIVIGYGRVGRLVCDMLEEHSMPYLGIDRNPVNVARAHRDGRPVFYGNARSEAFLEQCGIANAEAVIMTLNQPTEAEDLVRQVRGMRPEIIVIARARDAEHARSLYDLGATDAVPETIEASLQLAEASLVGLGVAAGRVIASIHEKRDEFRHELQGAGGYAGQAGSNSTRHGADATDKPQEKPADPVT